jgi:hypothetical protein
MATLVNDASANLQLIDQAKLKISLGQPPL